MTVAIGLLAGMLTTGAWLPQLWRTWRLGNADGVSASYLAVFGTGIAVWLVYGIASGQLAVIVTNALTFVLVGSLVWLKFRDVLEGRRSTSPPPAGDVETDRVDIPSRVG